MKKLNNKGFSLVELIIVIAIMVVLIGLLAPQFIRWVEKSKEATDIQNLDSALTVVQAYLADKTVSGDVTVSFTGTGNALKVAGTDADDTLFTTYQVSGVLKGGAWTTSPSVTISGSTGALSYAGESDYYEPDGSAGYKAK